MPPKSARSASPQEERGHNDPTHRPWSAMICSLRDDRWQSSADETATRQLRLWYHAGTTVSGIDTPIGEIRRQAAS